MIIISTDPPASKTSISITTLHVGYLSCNLKGRWLCSIASPHYSATDLDSGSSSYIWSHRPWIIHRPSTGHLRVTSINFQFPPEIIHLIWASVCQCRCVTYFDNNMRGEIPFFGPSCTVNISRPFASMRPNSVFWTSQLVAEKLLGFGFDTRVKLTLCAAREFEPALVIPWIRRDSFEPIFDRRFLFLGFS